jgi:glycosyltransferase involved in cell wall biosynthesis
MITFVDYQYKGIGGVSLIVLNTAIELNRRNERCKIYCASDSWAYSQLIKLNVDCELLDSNAIHIDKLSDYLSPEDVIVITHVYISPLLNAIKKLSNRVVFYSVHPETFFCYPIHLDYIANLQKRNILPLVKLLLKHNSLKFMDYPNVESLETRVNLKVDNLDYLPVPVSDVEKSIRGYKVDDKVTVTYLGRGNEDWKIYPVVRILKDLNSLGNSNIMLTVITDTNSMFEDFIARLVSDNKIKVNYINGLSGTELENYLKQNSDIHFAMGTSVLEAAKLGIPSINIDGSKKEMPDSYRYKWNFQMKDFSLGSMVTDVDVFNGMTIEEVWSIFNDMAKYDDISSKCLEYTRKNHSIEAFVDILKEACDKTTLTTDMYCSTSFSKIMLYVTPKLLKFYRFKSRVGKPIKSIFRK